MNASTPTRAIAGLVLVLAAFSPACQDSDPVAGVAMPAVLTRTVEVGPLRIDGIAHSMEGEFQRAPLDTAEIGWITALRTEVVDAATGLPMGDEFFCHSQVQMDTGSRLMVAATGIREVRLPDGFGIPLQQILGDLEPEWRGVSLMGMVLNNHDPDLQADVNVRFNVDYVAADDETAGDLVRPLYRASVTILPDKPAAKVFEGDPLAEVTAPRTAHGKTGHWVVPPGMQIVKQQYRGLIGAETQVHFGVVHLHNYGRLISLTDVTSGEVLWQVEARYAPDRDQIVEIAPYVSTEGFTLRPDHVYELAVVYDNTTDEDVDAMATMYLYHEPAGGRTLTYPPPAGAEPPSEMADTASGHQH
jgi:hypothetical protein